MKNLLFLFSPFLLFKVVGNSMYPTFKSGERVVVQKWLVSPAIGDVVVLRDPRNGRLILKRITKIRHLEPPKGTIFTEAAQSEGSSKNDSRLKIQDSSMTENKIAARTMFARKDEEYFVQGDNTKESTDSRVFGWIPKNLFIGKVIWPKK